MMDFAFFQDILSVDSTSGQERALSDLLCARLPGLCPGARLERFEVGDGTENLLLSWGTPQVVFCTHLDTVPPYIAPSFLDASGAPALSPAVAPSLDAAEASSAAWRPSVVADGAKGAAGGPCSQAGAVAEVRGRGACDAKGQIFAMLSACRTLAAQGRTGFGLLLLSGEETGSWGAKAFSKVGFRAPWLIVGEPTDGKMVSASKGTLSYDLHFTGVPFHSGYPEYGRSAVELFTDFMVELEYTDFPKDKLLGATTWNVGLLRSDNPQNILSPALDCRLYFRTTFASHAFVQKYMEGCRDRHLAGPERGAGACRMSATPRGGDEPAVYCTLDGFPSGVVAFGSDAPHLSGFANKIICGPGSIRVAHRDDERITAAELERAAEQYVRMFEAIS